MNNTESATHSDTGSSPTSSQHDSGEPHWTKEHFDGWLRASKTYREIIRNQGSRIPHDGTMRNGESWVEFDQFLEAERPYLPTFTFPGDYIDATHRALAEAPLGAMGLSFLINLGVEGYLRRAEALKLYEMARFTDGDVLELGTFKGLSAMIMANALRSRGGGHLTTVDLTPETTAAAAKMLQERLLSPWVTLVNADAAAGLDRFISESRRFGFVFVDHWHGYNATRDAIDRLPNVMREGAFVLFHDFNDVLSADPDHAHKVYPAVIDTIAQDERFEFYGIFGSAGLFRLVG